MGLQEQLNEDMKVAMKKGDKLRLETIRMVRAQMKDAQIAKMAALSPEDELGILQNAAKKRREAIELYKKGGRDDLLEKEMAELAILGDYLPKALTQDEVLAIIDATIQETGAQSAADFGKVMGKVAQQTKGRADGKVVQQLVRERLGQAAS
jgi:uncharacterized protein YqeY